MSRWLVTISGATREAIEHALKDSAITLADTGVDAKAHESEDLVLTVEAEDGEGARREVGRAIGQVKGLSVGAAARAS